MCVVDSQNMSGDAFVALTNPDLDVARDLIKGAVSIFARFSVMHGGRADRRLPNRLRPLKFSGFRTSCCDLSAELPGTTIGPLSAAAEKSLHDLHNAYDMEGRSRNESQQAASLTPDFIDRFGVVGSPDLCVARFAELGALGLDKIVIAAQFQLDDTDEGRASKALMEAEVVPAVAI